jgi:Uri superfamily endonuclease
MADVGALGTLVFSPGRYIYVGSALNGIEPRVSRHLRTNGGHLGSIHWHIDYLLTAPGIVVDAVYTQARRADGM